MAFFFFVCFDCLFFNEGAAEAAHLSLQGVLAGGRGRPRGERPGRVALLDRHSPVEAGVACGPAAWAHDVRAAAADQPVGERVALLGVLQLRLGQAVGHEERVAGLRPQGAGLGYGRVRGRVGGPGVVHFRPHYCPGGGA